MLDLPALGELAASLAAPWWHLGGVGLLVTLGMVHGPGIAEEFDTDEAMVKAVKAGDHTAYRGLVEKYQDRVYSVIYGMVRNREQAQDLTQETFVKGFRRLDAFREQARFYTWIYRVARNVAIDHIRRQKRREMPGFDEGIAVKIDGRLSDRHNKELPNQELERKQLYKAIMDAVELLPPDQKQVLLLRELEGMSYAQMAEVCEVPQGTIMSRLYAARRRMRALLEEEHANL